MESVENTKEKSFVERMIPLVNYYNVVVMRLNGLLEKEKMEDKTILPEEFSLTGRRFLTPRKKVNKLNQSNEIL